MDIKTFKQFISALNNSSVQFNFDGQTLARDEFLSFVAKYDVGLAPKIKTWLEANDDMKAYLKQRGDGKNAMPEISWRP